MQKQIVKCGHEMQTVQVEVVWSEREHAKSLAGGSSEDKIKMPSLGIFSVGSNKGWAEPIPGSCFSLDVDFL
jgi:hypothetical protein